MTQRDLDDPIVVTGMGALAAGAASPEELYEVALSGRSRGEWVELAGLAEPIAASRAPDPHLVGPDLRYARRLDRSAQLGLAAATQAIGNARLMGAVAVDRVGMVIGTSRGPLGRVLETADEFARGSVSPTASAESTPASLNGVISQVFGLRGPGMTVTATCASAAAAISIGALQLLAGEADVVIVGGTESSLVPLLAAQLQAARVTGYDSDPVATCKPFDVARNGLMIGEGAGMLVLERASAAERRGVRALAVLSGWSVGSDEGGRTGVTADGGGLVRVIRSALRRASLSPRHIGYVNAHGTATRLNDPVEARSLNTVFGDGRVPPVSSTKPITGHCLGATPALEAILAIEALRNGCLPPTANHHQLDPECTIDVIGGDPRPAAVKAVLSTSLGFWGAQAALIFEAV